MKQPHNFPHATSFAVVSVAACLGLVHCSGGSAAATHLEGGSHSSSGGFGGGSSGGFTSSGGGSGGGDDGGPSSSGGGNDASVGGDASLEGGSDATPGGEGGHVTSTCQAPTGGAACNPGTVTCGSTTCSTSTDFCCASGGEAGAGTCTAYNSSSCPSGALTLDCDETADCTAGVCCEQIISLGVPGPTKCMASCSTGWFQVCKSHTECGAGGDAGGPLNRCVLQTCTMPSGLLGGGRSVVVEACAVPATLGNLNNNGALTGCVAN